MQFLRKNIFLYCLHQKQVSTKPLPKPTPRYGTQNFIQVSKFHFTVDIQTQKCDFLYQCCWRVPFQSNTSSLLTPIFYDLAKLKKTQNVCGVQTKILRGTRSPTKSHNIFWIPNYWWGDSPWILVAGKKMEYWHNATQTNYVSENFFRRRFGANLTNLETYVIISNIL